MAKSLEELRDLSRGFHFPRTPPELQRKIVLGIPIEPTSPERMKQMIAELHAKKKAP